MLCLKNSFFLFTLAVFLTASAVSAQDVVLITSPDISTDSLSAADVRSIFLGKKTTWDNGDKIKFFTLNSGPAHNAFLKTYVGRSSSQYKMFWKKQVFTGKGKMPQSVGSDKEMVNVVSSTSNAIGYVSAGTNLGSTKSLPVK